MSTPDLKKQRGKGSGPQSTRFNNSNSVTKASDSRLDSTPSDAKTGGSEIPVQMALPKGGGAIQGTGEKFDTNYFTGTMSITVPVFTTQSRSDFYPKLSLSYDSSGHGNGPFGMGWNISIPSITRKTEKGLPRYMDAKNSDTFILSGSEDLVPLLKQDGNGAWINDIRDEAYDGIQYSVQYYRPRIEGLFALIKKCTEKDTGAVHWRSISKDDITTIYGKSSSCQIADPDNPSHIFKWMIEESFDDKGNVIVYQYKQEDSSNVDVTLPCEANRLKNGTFSNRYIKRIFYGNQKPNERDNWLFEVVFDYGEHDINNNPETETTKWPVRQDPFSTYRSGFEIRTYRLCKKIMVFHNFDELGNTPYLVHSTDLEYLQGPICSFLKFVTSTGYIRNENEDGTLTYQAKSIPPLEFTNLHPHIDDTVHQIDVKSLENIPVGIDGNSYQWIDLESEGISGILSQQDGSWYYKHNLGNGEFGPMEQVAAIPSGNGQNGKQQVTELEDDGQKYVVQYQKPLSGYYKLQDDDNWQPFQPFQSTPNINWNDPNMKFVDLDGDGFADLLISQSDIFVWYNSRGKEGFGSYHVVPKEYDEEKGPALVFADPTQSIYIADMSGDGLADIVRIRNGEVCYWPNLGYGKFGTKIAMENSPVFDNVDQFDNNRIRLADIDGSGTSDILYIGRNKIRFWFNQSGNSYGKENVISNFPAVDRLSSVMTLDLLGKGTTCVVWSSPLSENAGRQMQYVDLMGGIKPYLLYSIKNNMGSETRIGYAESTKFYLDDLKAGKPWITKLPFPVHVVERIETYDYLSNTKLVSKMKYHHGYYDRHEREFRGFGLVEHWDTETFDDFDTSNLFSGEPDNSDKELHVPPVYTKTWYHTGSYHKEGLISRQFQEEYYQGDLQAALLPDSVIPDGSGQEDIYEALRSLKGQILRQEAYGIDGSASQDDPYTISEHNYNVTMIQSAERNRNITMFQSAQHVLYGIFYSHERETLDYHYERNPSDPRIEHKFVLQLDDYGNVEKLVTVYYPRRLGAVTVYPEQSVVRAVANLTDYAQIVTSPQDTWLVGVEYQSKSYEIFGLTLPASSYFDFDYINSLVSPLQNGSTDFNVGVAAAGGTLQSVIDFGTDFTPGQIQARIFNAQRKYYWQDSAQTNSNLGQISVPLLPSYTERVVFPQSYAAKIYGANATVAILNKEGGYQQDHATGYWWDPGKTQYYFDDTKFYLPNITIDPFGSYNPATNAGIFYKLTYDPYNLFPVTYKDPLSNQIQISKMDYRVVKPTEVIDFNGNYSQAKYDELGMVQASSVFGTVNGTKSGDGDITNFILMEGISPDDFITHTENYIQNATAIFYYDYFAWLNEKNPPYSISAQRVLHQSDQSPNTNPTFQISILYTNGQGRALQKKLMAEEGMAWVEQAGGTYTELQCDTRWVTTGRTVYNNKGKPVKQYEPFYSGSYNWDSEKSLTQFGVTPVIHYDPLERVIRTDTPKGFFSSVAFDPWSQENWDEDDNVASSKLYDEIINQGQNPFNWNPERLPPETQALTDTATNSGGTPKTMYFDVLGHTFMEMDLINSNSVNPNPPNPNPNNQGQLFTYYGLDISGNKLWIVDPRQYLSNQTRSPANQVLSFQFFYDMQNRQLEVISMDAGTKTTLQDALNKPIYLWTARDYQVNTKYDYLRRPIAVIANGVGLANNLVEKIVYGNSSDTGVSSEKQMNQIGKPISHSDQAGIKKFLLYGIDGHSVQIQTMIRDDYQNEVDWNGTPATSDVFNTQTTFDTFGKVTGQVHTDNGGSQIDNRKFIYHPSGRLKSIRVQLDTHGIIDNYVTDIEYNAKSQRLEIVYGNGTTTTYGYEPTTFRLESIVSATSGGKTLQDLLYVYDPVGNITWLKDKAIQTIFYNQAVIKPVSNYAYDSLYHLIQAGGRQHPAIMYNDYKNTDYTNNPDLKKQSRYISINNANALENYTQAFSYDPAGNLLQIQHTVEKNKSRWWTRTNTYDPNSNRLIKSAVGSAQGNETNPYAYDAAGNMTNLEQLKTIAWNYRDKMSYALLIPRDGIHDDKEYYVYGTDGIRTRKVLEQYQNIGGTFKYVQKTEKIYLDGYEIKRIYRIDLQAGNAKTLLERFSTHVMDDKNRVVIIHKWTKDVNKIETSDTSLPKIHYQLGNNLGSCTLELDDQEQIISYEEYYPFGGTSFIAGSSASASLAVDVSLKDYRYTGKECDDSTSLYYYGARYYVPWIARWSSCDPAQLADGLNLFIFCRNNPIIIHDPDGHKGNKDKTVIGGPEIRLNHSFTGKETREQLEKIAESAGHTIKGSPRWEKGYGWRAQLIPIPSEQLTFNEGTTITATSPHSTPPHSTSSKQLEPNQPTSQPMSPEVKGNSEEKELVPEWVDYSIKAVEEAAGLIPKRVESEEVKAIRTLPQKLIGTQTAEIVENTAKGIGKALGLGSIIYKTATAKKGEGRKTFERETVSYFASEYGAGLGEELAATAGAGILAEAGIGALSLATVGLIGIAAPLIIGAAFGLAGGAAVDALWPRSSR